MSQDNMTAQTYDSLAQKDFSRICDAERTGSAGAPSRAELRSESMHAVPLDISRARYLARLGIVSSVTPTFSEGGSSAELLSSKTSMPKLVPPDEINLNSFHLLQQLGKGSFGRVMKVQRVTDGQPFAMKILSKATLVERNALRYLKSERRVLEQANHPFVVQLHYAFNDHNKFYLVLELCSGGDLAFHLDCEELNRFSEQRAAFYAAEVFVALDYLHGLDIIYRDLKPDNILLDTSGHVRITDFGLCKENIGVSDRSLSFCGSPAYLSPEMLAGTGHGHAADWYGFGVLLFEMLAGLPPFYCRDRTKMWNDIRHRPINSILPSFISKEASLLLCGLLEKETSKRLGCTPGPKASWHIREHCFFADTDWQRLLCRECPPPIVPDDDYTASGSDKA